LPDQRAKRKPDGVGLQTKHRSALMVKPSGLIRPFICQERNLCSADDPTQRDPLHHSRDSDCVAVYLCASTAILELSDFRNGHA
jgi:hypothetical protein